MANRKNKVKDLEVVCVLDRSGSMQSIKNDAIGGFNSFLEEQRKNTNIKLTVILFDDQYELLYDRVKITDVVPLTTETFVPRGSTALNDSIGKTLARFKELRNKNEIDSVTMCVLTDGGENASKEFSTTAVKELMTNCEKEYKWEFIYLAANQDAFAVGTNYGFRGIKTANVTASAQGMKDAFRSLSQNTQAYYNCSINGEAYTDFNLQDLVDDKVDRLNK